MIHHYQPSKEVQKPALETFPRLSIGLWQTHQLRRPARRPPSPIKAPPNGQRRLPVQSPPAPTRASPHKERITLPPCSPPLLTPSLIPLPDLETLPRSFTLQQTRQQIRPSPFKAPPNSQRRRPFERPPTPTRAPRHIESITLPPRFPALLTPSLPLQALETRPSQSFILQQTRQQSQRRPPQRPPSPIKAPQINQRSQPVDRRSPAPTRAPPHIKIITLPSSSTATNTFLPIVIDSLFI